LKIIAWVAVAVAVVIASNSFYLEDKKTTLQKAVSEEADLKHDFEKKAFDAKNLTELRKQMEEATKTLGALLKQLPSQTEVPGLLEDITKTGNGSGLEFSEIKIQPEKKVQFYVELPISITVKGGYHDFATFVSGISSLPRIVSLHDFTIKPKTEKDTTLTMQIMARTYRADSVDVGLEDSSGDAAGSKTANSKPGDSKKEGAN
jgi:type IV pilus assembly protein PilO